MGNEADKSGEGDKPIKAPVLVQDGADDTTTTEVEDDQARLSQSAWFGDGPPNGSNGTSGNGTPAKPAETAAPQDGAGNGTTPQEVTVTPIQTVLTPDAAQSEGQPVVAQVLAEGEEKPAGPQPAVPAQAERPPAQEVARGQETGDQSQKVEAAPQTDIEKLKQAIVEADKNAPVALKALADGRGATLDLVRTFVATDKTGQNDQVIEGLKTQEIKQVKEYIDYLKPGTTRADLGNALIAKGDDASVREGERKLVEAVQARPDLIFHPNFRAQLMDSYTKMAQFRKSNGLEPWKSEIDIADLVKNSENQQTPWVDKSGEHFGKANELFFNSGVKAALPEFQQAISAADETAAKNQTKVGNERLVLFVDALKADRAIAQGQVTGESTSEIEKRRVDIWQKQVDNYVEDAVGSRARMNVGLAMVASGDPDMLAQGKQQLLDAVGKHPGLVYAPGLAAYSNEFTERLFGAYKANVENSAAKPGTTDGAPGTSVTEPGSVEDLQSGYDKNKITNAPLPAGNDTKVESYGWDTATDIGLPIATLGLMIYTGRRQYKNYQARKAEREANFQIEPTDGAQKDVVSRQGTNGEEKLEIKGRAKDGQVVVKNLTEGADTSAKTRPPIDPPKDFNPGKGKYAEYQPIKVDDKKYYLNKKGEAFEHREGKLHPTDLVRGLSTQDIAAQELKALPRDMQRTPFDLHGRSLTALGTLADGRVLLQNDTTGGSPLKEPIKVPDGVDPLKGEFQNFQHQRLAGKDYFISPDNKVYTMLQPERQMMEVESIVVKPADAVYKATGAPGTSAAERAINKQVNDILEPLRQQLRAGEYVDPKDRMEYLKRAKEALLPYAKQTAKDLGMPEGVVTDQTIRYSEIEGKANHNSSTGEITIDIFSDSHVEAIDHELKHKQRTLDMVAAAEADPRGYRLAMLDQTIKEVGTPGRRFTENGIDSRPKITSPEAVAALKDIVKNEALYRMAERGEIPWSDVSLESFGKETPKVLIDALGSEENVYLEVEREVENFEKIKQANVLSRDQLNEASRQHIDKRVEFHKQWLAEHPSLKDSPHVGRLLESVSTDTLGLYHGRDATLRPYYRFSSDEIGARKQQIGRSLRRLRNELAENGDNQSLRDHPEGKQLLERGEIARDQQRLVIKRNQGDVEGAKTVARDLLAKMGKEPERYIEDVRFMQEKELLTEAEIGSTKFAQLLKATQRDIPSLNDIEMQRMRQQQQASRAVAERVSTGEISGSNLEARQPLEGGGYEYKLKKPVTIDGGTDIETKVLSIIEKDGQLQLKYVNAEGKTRVDAEIYSDYLKDLETATRQPGNPRTLEERAKIASDFLEEVQARERSEPLAALDEFNKTGTGNGGNEFKLDLQRLEAMRERIIQAERSNAVSSQTAGDRVQVDVYDVLNGRDRPNAGIMAKLKEGMVVGGQKLQISGDWELFPTQSKSPADRIGADYLLVNKRTGEFHFLDATANPDKQNVFDFRKAGVIDISEYDMKAGTSDRPGHIFDKLGSLKWSGNEKPTDPEEAEGKRFFEDLARKINDLTKTKSPFKLGETPMTDIVRYPLEQEKAQIERLIGWAREQARQTGEPQTTDPHRRGPFTDMAETLEKRALKFLVSKGQEQESVPFEKQVRSVAQREIARYLAAKFSSSEYEQSRSTSTSRSNVYPNGDRMKFDTGSGEILMTKEPTINILNQELTVLQSDPAKLAAALSGKEIRSLNPTLFDFREFRQADGKPLKDKGLKDAVLKALADTKHPRHNQLKLLFNNVANGASKNVIINGGAEGRGRPVISDNIVASLKDKSANALQGIEEVAKPKVDAKPAPMPFSKDYPKSALELKELVSAKEKLSTKEFKQDVLEAMELLQDYVTDEQEKKKFEELTRKYKAKDAETIKRVHEFLNGEEAGSEGARPVSELRESDGKPIAAAAATVSSIPDAKLAEFRDMMRGLEQLARPQFLNEAMEKARNTLKGDVSFANRTLFKRTAVDIKESSALKAGESELVITKAGEVIKPTRFVNGGEPSFVTEGGARVALKDCKVEIRVGAGTPAEQAARETLIRVNDLAGIMENRAGNPAAKNAEAVAIRERFGAVAHAEGQQRAGLDVATRAKELGAFDFGQKKQVKVELTQNGVRFGEHGEIAYRDLVQETIKKKQTELAELKKQKGEGSAEAKEMEGRIAELQTLERAVQGGDAGKLMEAIEKSTSPKEIARLRREMARGPGYVKAGVGTLSAVAMVGAFVATLLVSGDSAGEVLPKHITWKAAG